MLKASERHLRSCNLNSTLRANLLALLAESAPLLRHDRLATLLLGERLLTNLIVRLRDGNAWNPHTLRLYETGGQG